MAATLLCFTPGCGSTPVSPKMPDIVQESVQLFERKREPLTGHSGQYVEFYNLDDSNRQDANADNISELGLVAIGSNRGPDFFVFSVDTEMVYQIPVPDFVNREIGSADYKSMTREDVHNFRYPSWESPDSFITWLQGKVDQLPNGNSTE